MVASSVSPEAMREDGGIAAVLRKRDGVERFSERTDLVHLHENRVRRAGINSFFAETSRS